MADRSVSVFLRANITGYTAAIEKAKLQTRDFARDASKSASTHKEAWDRAGKGFLITGGVIAAGIGLAVKAAMEFQAQMAQVKSLSGATAAQMKQLEQAAKTTGQAFGISAKEAADAETELIKAGISVTDILGGGLKGALILAADGQMNVADATRIAASSMVQFGLAGKDIPHIADLLAAGADKALGSVGDLGQALESSGTVAHQWGLTVEETVGTLSEFAAAGQIGEKGGTLLRQTLLQLSNAQGPAKALMDKYGFSVETAGGGLANMSQIAGRLQTSFGGLDKATQTHALAVIFGTHAIQGANILMKDGAKINADWTAKVNDAGFAAKQAAGKMDSLAGDVQKMKAAFQTALIDTGEQATGALRGLTKGTTGVIEAFDKLSPFAKTIIVDLGGVLAVTTLVGGAALVAVPKVVAFKAALAELGLTAKGTAASLEAEAAAGVGGGVGKGGKVLGLLGGAAKITGVGTAIAIGADAVQSEANREQAGRVKTLSSDPAAMAAARQRLAAMQAKEAGASAAGARGPVGFGAKLLSQDIALATAAMKANAAASPAMVDGVKKIDTAASGGAISVADFDAAIKGLSGRFSVRTQTDAMTEAFRALAVQAKKTGTAVHGNSDAAIANRTALTQQYQAALGIIQTYKDQGHTAADVKKKTADVTQQFINQAGKAGFVKTKIQNYIDALHLVPANVPSKVTLDTSAATLKLQRLNSLIAATRYASGHAYSTPGRVTPASGGYISGGKLLKRGMGGPVWGPGTGTSDSVPAMLSNGEFVVNAASVKAIGVQNLHALNRYARGGQTPGADSSTGMPGGVNQTNHFYDVKDPTAAADKALARLAWARK